MAPGRRLVPFPVRQARARTRTGATARRRPTADVAAAYLRGGSGGMEAPLIVTGRGPRA
jgi:hypothetical protein